MARGARGGGEKALPRPTMALLRPTMALLRPTMALLRPTWSRRVTPATLVALALASLLGGCTAAPPPEPPSPLSLYLQARVARHRGEPGRAALLLTAAGALAPDQAPIFAALGEARLVLGDDVGARAALERAVMLEPEEAPATVLLARLDVRDRQPEAALARLLAIDERRPGRKDVLELAHPLLLWSGETQRGLEVFDRALQASPDLALAHEARGDFLACLGRPDEALASYRRALALDPRRRGAELKAAHLLEKQGDAILRKLHATAAPGVGLPSTEEAAPGTR